MELNIDDVIIRRLGSDDVMIAEQLIQLFKDVFEAHELITRQTILFKNAASEA